MKWNIPGTVLQIRKEAAEDIEDLFSSMFLAGGITLSQIASITGLEPYTVQNWVKRGFLTPPKQKRYTLRQLCRIININMLKSAFPMEKICGLLGYVNGRLNSEEDDIIDDSALYFLFVRLCAKAKQMDDPASLQQAQDNSLQNYAEPYPGAKERIEKALKIMLTAWLAARMQHAAHTMLEDLLEKE